MKVSEKIDFLMKLTETSNSVLGKYLTFDASYISRIRSGKRNLPRNQPFVEPASAFFAAHIENGYQKKMAGELVCPGKDWPDNRRTAQKLLAEWLSLPEDAVNASAVGGILSGISSIRTASLPAAELPANAESSVSKDVQFFYGNEGKRQAVLLFLSELGQMEDPPQLLLYSNEEFNWMYEDPVFSKKWALLLFAYIKRGGHIKIAHTISRASGEMLVALQKWIPVYMTGAIEPYYYPKILDRVFRKTLFIAEGYSAIMASSVGEHTDSAINCLVRDPGAVHALESEYWSFFEMCRPLMQIFNMAGRDRFFEVLKKFNGDTGSMITVRTTPSFYTMPEAVAKSMTERLDNGWVLKRRSLGEEAFLDMMESGSTLTEVLNLPEPEAVRSGTIAFPMCDLFDKPGLYYTAGEFAAHLESVLEKLRTCPGYQVVLSSAIPANEIVYVKEDMGVILIKSDAPTIAFAINEQRMVSAFWNYLSELLENSGKREKTIRYLENYLEQIRG